MFVRVFYRVTGCSLLSGAHVATDDSRIRECAEEYGIPVVMTSSKHASGTDRVREAADLLGLDKDCVVLNVQGDEPALVPEMLQQLLKPFGEEQVQVSTLARRISPEEASNPSLVKVVLDQSGRALYFSRSPVPYPMDPERASYWGHVGLYAYTSSVLRRFSRMPPSPLETAEKLEQLRLLEAGIPIHVGETEHTGRGVDNPEDVEAVERLIEEQERCGLS